MRAAKADAPDPIAVEVARLWADLGAKGAIRRYRASVKIAYREALRPPAAQPRKTARGRTARA